MISFKIDSKKFLNDFKKEFEKQTFVVGILENVPGKIPLSKKAGYRTVEGVRARKIKGNARIGMQDLGGILQKKYNWLLTPLKQEKNIESIVELIADYVLKRDNIFQKLAEILKVHIKEKKYRPNKISTEKRKGFNHSLVDTGSFLKNIKEKLEKRK